VRGCSFPPGTPLTPSEPINYLRYYSSASDNVVDSFRERVENVRTLNNEVGHSAERFELG
jgi:hypothetical protein